MGDQSILDKGFSEETQPGVSGSRTVRPQDAEARFVLFRGGNVLLERSLPVRPAWISSSGMLNLGLDTRQAVLLETDVDGSQWALDVQDQAFHRVLDIASYGEFQDLHGIQEPIDPRMWATLSKARVLLRWNREARLCPTCGAPTCPRNGATYRVCSSSSCGRILYPRTEPSVIVRVVFNERILLVRKPQFPPGLRGFVAGFVEPGETLEQAACREVKEEVGIELGQIAYLDSQPWPFPACLMIAFEAHGRSATIHVDHRELEAADWYTRERVRQEAHDGRLVLPSRKSIARRMLEAWLNDQKM